MTCLMIPCNCAMAPLKRAFSPTEIHLMGTMESIAESAAPQGVGSKTVW